MKKYIGCDMHKKYSVFVEMDETGKASRPMRVEHRNGELEAYLSKVAPGTPIAIEASGGWYWMFDLMESVGLKPVLANALKVRNQIKSSNKTDGGDALGLAMLVRNGTLPEVWVPDARLRDLRGLMRSRLRMRRITTMLKNRIQAALRRYGIVVEKHSDPFADSAKGALQEALGKLPALTAMATRIEWGLLVETENQITQLEGYVANNAGKIGAVYRLQTLPGVGKILGPAIYLEMGDAGRFASAEKFVAYCGLVSRIHSSGGHTRQGRLRKECNASLKWAFVEAAEAIVCHQRTMAHRHVVRLFQRVKQNRKERHGKAVVAVARHLAEAAWHMMRTQQDYREPQPTPGMLQRYHVTGRSL
jgi:transposase